MMSLEPRNEPQMLQWFRRTYPSYNLQPLLLKRQRELEEAQAFNAWLGERRLAQEGQRHLDDVSRLTEAVRRVARRAQGRRTCSGRSCATVNMKTLRAHGFSQRPRFEQVVGYLERNEPLPLDQPDRKPPRSSRATSTWTTSCSPVRTPTRSLCSTRP